MEKELFQSTLLEKAKAANNNAPIDNLSERTITEVVNLFLPQFADDTKITDESWNLPVQMVKTLSGQLRHDTSAGINAFKTQFEATNKTAQEKAIADAVAAAKAEWEKNHPTKEPPKNEPPKQEPDIEKLVADKVGEALKGLTGEDSEFGKLSKQFGDFLKKQAEREKATTEAGVRAEVRGYLIGRGVEEDDFALEYTLEKLVIGDNPDVNALKTKAEKDYEANYKKIHKGDGAQPFAGGGGNGGSVANEINEWAKKREGAAAEEAAAAAELEKHIFK
jgi:hypothetical protein